MSNLHEHNFHFNTVQTIRESFIENNNEILSFTFTNYTLKVELTTAHIRCIFKSSSHKKGSKNIRNVYGFSMIWNTTTYHLWVLGYTIVKFYILKIKEDLRKGTKRDIIK